MYCLVPEKTLRLVYEPFYLAIYNWIHYKHQIPNKSQIPNPNDLNDFDFSSTDENIFFTWNVRSSKLYTGLLFEILVIGICLLFEICYLEFQLS